MEKLLSTSNPILNTPGLTTYFSTSQNIENLLMLFEINIQERLRDVIALEQKKNVLYDTFDNPFSNHIQYLYDHLHYGDTDVKMTNMKTNKNITLHTGKWHWQEAHPESMLTNFENQEKEIVITLFQFASNKLTEVRISQFSYAIIEAFQTQGNYFKALKSIIDAMQLISPEDRNIAEEKFNAQVQELLNNRILIPEN